MNRILLPALLIATLCLNACLRQTESADVQVEHFSSGSLYLPVNPDIPRTIYINIIDSSGHTALSGTQLGALLMPDGFQAVSSPSEAGYILQVTLVQEGSLGNGIMEELVQNGYGTEAHFSGTGYSGWLADALLVRRLVPSDKRPSQTRLKNISSRNAQDNSKMRLGLQIQKELHSKKTYEAEFASELASHVANAILTPPVEP